MTIADSDKDVASGRSTENRGKCRRHQPEKFDHHSYSPSDQNSHSPNATQVTPPSKKRKPQRKTSESSPSKDRQRIPSGKNTEVKEARKLPISATRACGVSDNDEDPMQDLVRVKRELTVALESKAQEIECKMTSHASDDLLPGDGPTFRRAERKKHKAFRTEVAELRSLVEDYRAATDATRRETLLWIQEGWETLRKHPPSALPHPPTKLGYSHTSSAAVAPFPTTSKTDASMECTSGLAQQHRLSPQKWRSTTPNTSSRSRAIATPKSVHRQEGTTNNSPQISHRIDKKKKKRRLETRSCTAKDKNVKSATGKTPTHHQEQSLARILHEASTAQQGIEIQPHEPSKQLDSRDRRDSVESHPPTISSQANENSKKRSHVNSRPAVPKNYSARAQNLPTTDRTKVSASDPPKPAKRHVVSSTTAAIQSQKRSPKKYHATKVPQTRVWNTASHYREISMPLGDARTAQCTCSELPDHFLEAGPSGPDFRTWSGSIAEYLCHCEQVLACRGHSDMMRRTCREFYETEWPRFERQQCARAKEAAARRHQNKGSMSNTEIDAIIGEAHDFLADHGAEKEQREAPSNPPAARQHSTVPPGLFFHGIPPRSKFRIPPGLPYAKPPELGSLILGLESLTNRPSSAVLSGQPRRSHDPIPTIFATTDHSANNVIEANNKHGHSGVSSTGSCSLKAMHSPDPPVKSATDHSKTPSPPRSTKKEEKRKRQHSAISQQSPKRLQHQSHLAVAALESEPRAAPFQPSCCDDKQNSDDRNLDQSADQESTTPGSGPFSEVRRIVDDDYMGAMAFFDDDEMFPSGPLSPVHNASSPRPFAANAFMSGALTDHEAGIGAHPSTPTSPSPNGTMPPTSEANQPTQHRQGLHIRFNELSTPERRDRSIYRRYGTEPVLSASQLSPADAVRRQVSNIGNVFHRATAANTSLQPNTSEPRSTATSAPVLGTGTTSAASVAQRRQPKQPKMSLEERKRKFPPILPPYVGESEGLSDEVLIKVGTFHRPYERHSSAPYAYRYSSGKLTADYLYLAQLKHPDGDLMWKDEMIKKKLTSWKRLS
ncbi:MAG: hypothetical protein Q9212_000913 [Teloschistes hypoglaucus]